MMGEIGICWFLLFDSLTGARRVSVHTQTDAWQRWGNLYPIGLFANFGEFVGSACRTALNLAVDGRSVWEALHEEQR